jgi:hypothetical protein
MTDEVEAARTISNTGLQLIQCYQLQFDASTGDVNR